MEKGKPNYYSILPAHVRYDERLSSTEKLIYSEITALSNKEGFCWASNGYFAGLYKITNDQVSRIINNLAELKHIRVEIDQKAGNKRTIVLMESFTSTYLNKCREGIDKKIKHNTTRVNTTNNSNGVNSGDNYRNKPVQRVKTPGDNSGDNSKNLEPLGANPIFREFCDIFKDTPVDQRPDFKKWAIENGRA